MSVWYGMETYLALLERESVNHMSYGRDGWMSSTENFNCQQITGISGETLLQLLLF